MEAGGTYIQGYLWAHSNYEATLGDRRPCFQKPTNHLQLKNPTTKEIVGNNQRYMGWGRGSVIEYRLSMYKALDLLLTLQNKLKNYSIISGDFSSVFSPGLIIQPRTSTLPLSYILCLQIHVCVWNTWMCLEICICICLYVIICIGVHMYIEYIQSPIYTYIHIWSYTLLGMMLFLRGHRLPDKIPSALHVDHLSSEDSQNDIGYYPWLG